MKSPLLLPMVFALASGLVFSIDYDFSAIDKHIDAIAAGSEWTLDTLAEYIAVHAENEMEKARAVFRWITSNIEYDAARLAQIMGGAEDVFQTGKTKNQWAVEAMQNRVGVCASFAFLFTELADRIGLVSENVYGWYLPFVDDEDRDYQSAFKGRPDHLWNVVKINGNWFLLDGTTGDFLTPPKSMIETHYPENPYWQLLDDPVISWRPVGEPLTFPVYDEYDMELLEPCEYLIYTQGESVRLVLRAPQDITFYGLVVRGTDDSDFGVAIVERNGDVVQFSYDFSAETPIHTYSFVVVGDIPEVGALPVAMVKVVRLKTEMGSSELYEFGRHRLSQTTSEVKTLRQQLVYGLRQ